MDRRTFLATTGVAITGLAGCTDGSSGSSGTETLDGTPEPSSYETNSVGDVEVPLAPVVDTHYWHRETETRFVDARGSGQYQRSHITGAVLSPGRNTDSWSEPRSDDPTADWSKDERIVCYCRCPHHLSSLRAGELIENGYENVYAIDEGFTAWEERGYPTTGGSSDTAGSVIRGHADPGAAGEYAWANHEATDQREAAPIAEDGSYELTLHFGGLDPSAAILLRTPSYELTAPLSKLTDEVVTGSL